MEQQPERSYGAHQCVRKMRGQPVLLLMFVAFCASVYLPGLLDPYSPDEIGQIVICQWPLSRIVTDFAEAQNHPLYSLAGHFFVSWIPSAAGTTCRLPALIAGLLIPIVFFRTNRHWMGSEAAALTTLVLIVVDPVRHYAVAARGYAWFILAVVVMNDLVLRYLQGGRIRSLWAYSLVAVAGGYTHLWTVVAMIAHLVFVAVEAARRSLTRTRLAWFAVTNVACVIVLALAYLPMLPSLWSMARRPRSDWLSDELVVACVELFRFGHWTVPAWIVLTPLLLEGVVRKIQRTPIDRQVRFHLTMLLVQSALPFIVQPANFGSRFLVGMVPSVMALTGWALSGYWTRAAEPVVSKVPVVTAWLLGLAIGLVLAVGPPTYGIPWVVQRRSAHIFAEVYSRGLVTSAGNWTAIVLAGMACAYQYGWRLVTHRRGPLGRRQVPRLAVFFWTTLLAIALMPLIVIPFHPLAKWYFDLHKAPLGTILLLTWVGRFDSDVCRALRPGLGLCVAALGLWQIGFVFDREALIWLVGMVKYLPPALVVWSVARTTDPEPI